MIVVSASWSVRAHRELISADDWQDIGDSLVLRIVRRTRAGRDAQGSAFTPYSVGYAKQKAKEVGAGPVNLTLSGQMLNDLRVTAASASGVELGFSTFGKGARRGTMIQRSRSMGANDKAFYAVEGSHGIKRDFFDLSDEDEQFVADAVEQLIDARLQEGAA